MVKSRYLTFPVGWDERIRIMERNYRDGYYDFLYFNIVVNLLDARDNADYDKYDALKSILARYKAHDMAGVESGLTALKEML